MEHDAMSFATWFIDGNLYRLPDGTLISAHWREVNDNDATAIWQFEYLATGEPAIDVYPSGHIMQADPQELGGLILGVTRRTRSDLTIDDLRPA